MRLVAFQGECDTAARGEETDTSKYAALYHFDS